MTIHFLDGYFRASVQVPYAHLLRAKGWVTDVYGNLTTQQADDVLPFLEHLDPIIRGRMEQQLLMMEMSRTHKVNHNTIGVIRTHTPSGTPPLKSYQEAAIAYALEHEDTLIAEWAGTGKTAVMLILANILRPQRILIVTPANVKYNWLEREWPKWSQLRETHTIGVVESNRWVDTSVVIINPDILLQNKVQLDKIEWDLLIVDESHKFKNRFAKRTSMLLGGTIKINKDLAAETGGVFHSPGKYAYQRIRAKRRIFATATPMNRPKDLWTTIASFDPFGMGSDWLKWHLRYCSAKKVMGRWEINGADHLEELGARMRGKFMVRHKVDDLPPLSEEIVLLPPVKIITEAQDTFVHDNMDALLSLSNRMGTPLTPEAPVRYFMELIGRTMLEKASLIGEPEFRPAFTQFSKLRQLTGVAKLPDVITYIKDTSDDGAIPLVILAYHREVVDGLRAALPHHAHIMGGMPAIRRLREVDKFQSGEVNWFIGNIHAAGEGVTLTRANRAIFAEMDWSGATAIVQARQRVHRLTQDRPVRIDYLCAKDSFDAYVADNALEKIANASTTLDD